MLVVSTFLVVKESPQVIKNLLTIDLFIPPQRPCGDIQGSRESNDTLNPESERGVKEIERGVRERKGGGETRERARDRKEKERTRRTREGKRKRARERERDRERQEL